MGLGAMKLADMEEYIRVVYALLNGEMTEAEVDPGVRKTEIPQPRMGPDQHQGSGPAAYFGAGTEGAGR